ncbi:MAG: AAA domain-containing protein [Verrucomicrobiota bacterium]
MSEFEAAIGHKSVNQVYREDRAVNRFEGRTLLRKMELLEKRYREWLGLNARSLRMAVRQKFLEHVNISSLPAAQLNQEQKSFKKSYAAGRRDLEHEFGKTMRYKSIRDLAAGETGQVIQDLKPIWLMSPLSVSDTLPLDPELFDVVIFDEASQIPMEEAIPAIYRSHQTIVVGDEMQLPPTTFFASAKTDDESVIVEEEGERIEVDLDSDSFLTQSAQNLPSTLLAWHYRSRYEALISFSNSAFYSGNLYTIPDRQRAIADRPELIVTANEQGGANVDALLARSISFHFMENGLYEDRRNPNEAAYIAQMVREILKRDTKLSIGLVAFSEAQQGELESALSRLADEDATFAALLETEYVREENDVFCGLFVKNLENVQGDERDIIIMSVCYGHDANGRMLMNFGPINQRGGEKRLNVIFSRAKHHMAIVSSIQHHDITNDYNDGANSLKNFLYYAEAVSKGDEATARRVLENLNPLSRKALAPLSKGDAVVEKLAGALRERGYEVDLNVGQSKFRCDLAVRSKTDSLYQLGILVDTARALRESEPAGPLLDAAVHFESVRLAVCLGADEGLVSHAG